MNKNLDVRIKNKIDTTDNWQSNNPILLNGEIGIEVKEDNETLIKVGNGTSNWNNLDYLSVEKLANARNISLQGGATSNPASFDGSENITIDVTNIDSSKVNLTANQLSALGYIEQLLFAQNAFNGLPDKNILLETADKGSDIWETFEWSGRICDTNANPAVRLSCPKSKKFRFTFTADASVYCRIFGFLVTFSSQGGQISLSKFEAALADTDNFIVRDAIGGKISAWPGKFIVRCSQFIFGNVASYYYDKVRLTFECTEENTESYPNFIIMNIQALTHLVYNDSQKRIRMFQNDANGVIFGGNVTADRFIGQADSVADITKYIVLNHSNWSDSIYTINIQESGWLSEASTQEVFPSANITKEQLIAYQKAMIVGTNEFSGTTFTIKALGEVPTIDIPVQVLVRR